MALPTSPLHTPPRPPVADLSALGVCARRDLERCTLHEFEIAQLGNLLPDSADEAKALIPSLVEASITNEQLSEALEQLRGYRSYAS